MDEENNTQGNPFRCKGSFTRGTACGNCVRCQERGYTVEDKESALEAEAERTKDFPADRVKPDLSTAAPVVNVQVVTPTPEPVIDEPTPEEPVLPQPDQL